MIELQKSSFYDLLPPNLKSNDTRALSFAADRQFGKLSAKILKLLIYADIMSLDEWLCDYLALLLNIREYDITFSLDVKRKMIQLARRNSSKKGTAKAVNDIMSTIHSGASMEPWFQYGGDPYRFKINVDTNGRAISEDDYAKLLACINDYKALRSHLEEIIVQQDVNGVIFTAARSHSRIAILRATPNVPHKTVHIQPRIAAIVHSYYSHNAGGPIKFETT